MNKKICSILLSLFFVHAVHSGPIEEVVTVSDFLMISAEQQKISIGRYLNANKSLADRCMNGWSTDKVNAYFLSWVNDHPQYVRRNLTSAFSTALVDACKEFEKR